MSKYKHLAPQTKSFVILFAIAVVGTYLTVMVAEHPLAPGLNGYQQIYYPAPPTGSVQSATDRYLPSFKPVDTSAWKTYQDTAYAFSFKYDPAWKISPAKKQNGFYVLEIDPGAKFYNMKIYISGSGYYYSLDGLPVVETDIGSAKASDVSDLLYAIKMGPDYYTFDNGLSTAMMDGFNAMVRTVKFQ